MISVIFTTPADGGAGGQQSDEAIALEALGFGTSGMSYTSAQASIQNIAIQALNSGTSTSAIAKIETEPDGDGSETAGPTVQYAGFAGTTTGSVGLQVKYGFSVYTLPITDDPLPSLAGFNGVRNRCHRGQRQWPSINKRRWVAAMPPSGGCTLRL